MKKATKKATPEINVLATRGHSSYLTATVRCGRTIYIVEITRDICPKSNPTRALDVAIWGGSRSLSTARRAEIGLAATELYAARYPYADGFEAPSFRECEYAGSLPEYRCSLDAAGISR